MHLQLCTKFWDGRSFNQDTTECLGLRSSANTKWCLPAHYSALPAVVHIGVSYDLPDSSDYPCKLHMLQQVNNSAEQLQCMHYC